MTKKIYGLALLAAAVLAAAAGCDKEPESPDAYIAVYFEDAPADFKTFVVNIESVELYTSSEWVAMPLKQSSVSLLELTGGVSLRLAEGYFAPGDYTRLRITFAEEGNTLTETTETADLQHALVAGGSDRVREFTLELYAGGGSKSFLMLDMDAAAEGYRLVPALDLMDLNYCGAISGAIATSDGTGIGERMLVEMTSAGGVKKNSFTNPGTGRFFVRLEPGTYTMRIVPADNSAYLEYSREGLVVGEGTPVLLGPVKPEPKPR